MRTIKQPEPAQYVELRQRQTGHRQVFCLRPARPGDEEGMLACIRGEYRESYFKRDFYSTQALVKMARDGHYRFFVAETDGQIAAMVALTLFPNEDYIEPASQILLPTYRGYGLSGAMTRYLFPLAVERKPSCLFVHAVTFHDITQKNCEKAGFIPVGFRLGTFLTSRMENSYRRGRSEKYSEGILILPVEKKDAGTLFLPEELHSFAREIYHKLGVPVEIQSVEGAPPPALPARCVLSAVTDSVQRTVWIRVRRSGANLSRQIRAVLERFGQERLWTVQLTLRSDTPALEWEYQELKKLGFFFTGLKPLCGEHEGLYMQWIGDTQLHMEEYVLTEAFQALRDKILVFYRQCRQAEGGGEC